MTDEPLVLGIETSCDETGRRHRPGPHPARRRGGQQRRGARTLRRRGARGRQPRPPRGDGAHHRARLRDRRHLPHDIDAVAVTSGPGLAGALLVGVASAKALALGLGKPIYGVNHLAAHVAVDQLEHGPLPEPCLAMLVSGGHSSLLRVDDVTVGRRAARHPRSTTPRARPSTRSPGCSACPSRAARTSTGPPRVATRRDRLPARSHPPPRPRAAPLRLLVLRAQDRRRAVGRGPAAGRGADRRRRRRRVVPGGRLRRAHPQGGRRRVQPRDRGHPHRRWGRGQQPAARHGRGARRRARHPGPRAATGAVHRQRRDGRRARRRARRAAAVRRRRWTCRQTPRSRSRPSSPEGRK